MRALPAFLFLAAMTAIGLYSGRSSAPQTPEPSPVEARMPEVLREIPEASIVPLLPRNARVAILGDSITEQKLYSKYLETYLLACAGRRDIQCFQFGWGGETSGAFTFRMLNDLSVFQPTVATVFYGMNDGHYLPYGDAIGTEFKTFMRLLVDRLREAGVQHALLASPGAVDTTFFKTLSATDYNESLRNLAAVTRKTAQETQLAFVDVHTPMMEVMAEAKKARGESYDVAGAKDGIHPAANGHLLITQLLLQGLGLPGEIGRVQIDMKGTASANGDHRILSTTSGAVELDSSQWPFCFDEDPLSPESNRSILPFCSFNEDLNRFTLQVKNLEAARARVTWGESSLEFTREQLNHGINLAAEFPKTPFHEAFFHLMEAVEAKQSFETPMVKSMVTQFRYFYRYLKKDPELRATFDDVKEKLKVRHERLQAEVMALLVPVRHTIKVEALP